MTGSYSVDYSPPAPVLDVFFSKSDEQPNVLNKLALFLDGPQQMIDVLNDAEVRRLRARREIE